jgi:hypothetical protein
MKICAKNEIDGRRHAKLILASAALFAVVSAGAFVFSINPFYDRKQVVQDDRIIGTFLMTEFVTSHETNMVPETEQTNLSAFVIEKHHTYSQRSPGDYLITLTNLAVAASNAPADVGVQWSGTLFRIDDVLFMDLGHPKSGWLNIPDINDPLTLTQPIHAVCKIEISSNQICVWLPGTESRDRILKKSPELKESVSEETGSLVLTGRPAATQVYLRKIAADPMCFDWKMTLTRTGTNR